MFVRSLSAGGGSVDEIGNKAHRLSILTRYFNVPTGFVVTTRAYDLWKEEGKLPQEVVEEVKDYFTSPYLLEGKFPVVVRSSATVEDGSKASFAGGVFESITGVNSFDDLIKGIERVFESASSERVRAYMERMGLKEEPRMAAIVQREVTPEFAGVLFTRSSTEPEKALVEFVGGGAARSLWVVEKALSGFCFQETRKRLMTSL